ncbi:MAG TPA: glycosyltransferase family 2 protein, partial [Rhodothermales bacterium]|nr:glycosyltransferase family 2 protein [Rhodothermales bacterium]
WQQAHPSLQVLRIEKPEEPRKKHALTYGIGEATHDLLAFTDADCTPPPDWLATLAAQHAATGKKALLVGYSPFRKAPGLFNPMARYETFVTGFLTAAAIGLHHPYMAVGRNLSYPRSLFQTIEGFTHSLGSLSGDDDLLIQEVARRRAAPIQPVLAAETFVPSEPPASWQQWIRQKRRHLSAGQFYDHRTLAYLALFHTTSTVLWLAPLFLGWTGVGLLAAKLMGQGFVLRHAAHILHERDLLPAFPLLELGYMAYTLLMLPLGLARLPRRW